MYTILSDSECVRPSVRPSVRAQFSHFLKTRDIDTVLRA